MISLQQWPALKSYSLINVWNNFIMKTLNYQLYIPFGMSILFPNLTPISNFILTIKWLFLSMDFLIQLSNKPAGSLKTCFSSTFE